MFIMSFISAGIMKQVGYGAAGTVAGGFVGGPLGALVGGVAGRTSLDISIGCLS